MAELNTQTTVETNTEGQSTETTVTDTQTTEKTYTEAELQEAIQREADRRVTQALQKQQKKNEAKIAEAQKLASMNEAEKYEYQLKQREEAIAAKEKELALAENKNEAGKILQERGISLALVDFVVAEDAETMKDNIDLLDKAFKASVKAEVEKRMTSATPKKNLPMDKAVTKEDLAKMSIAQLSEFKRNNPDAYSQLTQH